MNPSRAILGALIVVVAGCGGSEGPPAPDVEAGPIAMRRLTATQYQQSIHDALGDDISIAGQIEPDLRRLGLLGVGSSLVSVTPSGFEVYESIAREVATQALDGEHRDANVPCTPASTSAADDTCAEAFVELVGRRLFRRPLTREEITSRVSIARDATGTLADFYQGLEFSLVSLLAAPDFLFRIELDEPDGPLRRLTSSSMASRLSYLLWDTAPDEELLIAAERGDLVTNGGVRTQLLRMLESPRFERGVRALFSDMYGFDAIDAGTVRKDGTLHPAFSQTVIQDAKEQTLRTIIDVLVTQGGDFRELMTTRKTFMTRELGPIYQVPVTAPPGEWTPFEFDEASGRAGLLTHISLLSLYSHPGRSSPTLRGKFVSEVLLCLEVPPPPGNVDFSIAEQVDGPLETARERLEVHSTDDSCAGCHAQMDSIGLALENFDTAGTFRAQENGVDIDASGTFRGRSFDDAAGLGAVLAEDPLYASCFVENVLRQALGRQIVPGERDFLDFAVERFDDGQYRLDHLLEVILTSDVFRTTSGPLEAQGGSDG